MKQRSKEVTIEAVANGWVFGKTRWPGGVNPAPTKAKMAIAVSLGF